MLDDNALNTHYFLAWNEDYKHGGMFHSLGNSEFRTIVILQAYANNKGEIKKENGKGYSVTELTDMFGMNWRTVKQALKILQEKNLIRYEDNIIYLAFFLNNQTDRKSGSKKGSVRFHRTLKSMDNNTVAMTRSINELNARIKASRYSLTEDNKVLDTESGVVYELDEFNNIRNSFKSK